MTRRVEQIRELVTDPVYRLGEKVIYHCDKCGKELDEDDYDDLFPNVLEIYCNLEQCVSDRVRMDLCTKCLLPIWKQICEAIGADPEAGELRIGQDD
jgi:hypothetical protein